MDEKYIGRKITYRNDALEGEKIKEVVAYGFDERYPNFLKVIDYPFNGALNKHMVFFPNKKRKKERTSIKESGDWHVGKELSFFKRRRLNHLLEKK